MNIQVFDPAMCCSSGICGPSVDPALPRFAADLDWLRSLGHQVERFNLAQQPEAFVAHPLVQQSLTQDGPQALPMIVADGRVVVKGEYLERSVLAAPGIGVLPETGVLWLTARYLRPRGRHRKMSAP